MGSYNWGYKSPNIGCNHSYPTYTPTYYNFRGMVEGPLRLGA